MRAAIAAVIGGLALLQSGTQPADRRAAPTIYSADPSDSWNRIFAALFTRTVRTSVTDEHAGSGPFVERQILGLNRATRISTRTFDRLEEGDRAIEAFYPSFMTRQGIDVALAEPRGSTLRQALDDALGEQRVRAPLARALMQSDLWSAFDALATISPNTAADRALTGAAAGLLSRIAQLVARIALTPAEIEALPDNYAAAGSAWSLPDVFAPSGGWMEIQWSQQRMHDGPEAAMFRHAARVFIRPPSSRVDQREFLLGLTRQPSLPPGAAAALLEQELLVDRELHVRPTHLISDVQIRALAADARGGLKKTTFEEFELSRRMLLERPLTGGFLRFDGGSPAYLALAGNDYGFATPDFSSFPAGAPVLGTLQSRCNVCHGPTGGHLMSFSLIDPERMPPPIRFSQPNDVRARYVADLKEHRPEFAQLVLLAKRKSP